MRVAVLTVFLSALAIQAPTPAADRPNVVFIMSDDHAAHAIGVPMFNRFDSPRRTVATLLQESGDHTGMVGKWHPGSDPVGFDGVDGTVAKLRGK